MFKGGSVKTIKTFLRHFYTAGRCYMNYYVACDLLINFFVRKNKTKQKQRTKTKQTNKQTKQNKTKQIKTKQNTRPSL